MATRTVKICDRCGAEHQQGNNGYVVQTVEFKVPISNSLHTTGTTAKELCQPCRRDLSSLIQSFLDRKVERV